MKFKIYFVERLTRWESFQLLSDSPKFIDKNSEEMPEAFTNKVEEMRKAFDIYDVELVQERRPTVHQLLQAEEERDYAVRKIYQLICYYADYRFNREKERNAITLKKTFKRYGTGSQISRLPQDTKTAIITNLLQELATDISAQHIVTLNLTAAVSALETSNLIFKKEQQVRSEFQSKYVTDVAKNARMDVQNQFMELITLINALAVVEGQEKYAKLKQYLSSLVQGYMAQARQRRKKKVEQV